MNKLNSIFAVSLLASVFTACSKKEADPIIVVPPSDGSTMQLNGLIANEAGSAAGNSVYVDFSANKQVSAARGSWDLGFYGGDEFRVIINHSVGATAKILDKTDLNQVTAADTVSLVASSELALGQGDGAFNVLDPVEGNKAAYLSGTVIKEISATDANNKVYIVNRGSAGITGNRGWQKIRVIRNGNGYTLQYAKITETSFKTINVTKDNAYNFKYVSFVNGVVNVEPSKSDWDIQWGLTTYKYSSTIPYTFSDFIIINFLAGVQAAEVSTSTVAYADFKESNLSTVNFKSERDVIGAGWRTSPGISGVGSVKSNVFYVVKDGSGNVYKLKFNSYIETDGGTRGKPVVEFKLVKKG